MALMSRQIRRARLEAEETAHMAAEVREGLSAAVPTIPCKYFYDDAGSDLFEEITHLPEYYLTRTEEGILAGVADEVVAAVGPRELVELGSGAGRKTRLLLDAMARAGTLERCVLLDINARFLSESVERLQADYPRARVEGVVGDFVVDFAGLGPGGARLMLFLASTIGNLHPSELPGFFTRAAAALAPPDGFLLGLDLVKDTRRLEAAYNDAAGVTARFNRNVLAVLNTRLGADFDLDSFEHRAFYDAENAWIEMRLRAQRPMRVRIPAADLTLRLARGDEIRTELSCKFTRESLIERLGHSGLALEKWFTDRDGLFAVALLRKAPRAIP